MAIKKTKTPIKEVNILNPNMPKRPATIIQKPKKAPKNEATCVARKRPNFMESKERKIRPPSIGKAGKRLNPASTIFPRKRNGKRDV